MLESPPAWDRMPQHTSSPRGKHGKQAHARSCARMVAQVDSGMVAQVDTQPHSITVSQPIALPYPRPLPCTRPLPYPRPDFTPIARPCHPNTWIQDSPAAAPDGKPRCGGCRLSCRGKSWRPRARRRRRPPLRQRDGWRLHDRYVVGAGGGRRPPRGRSASDHAVRACATKARAVLVAGRAGGGVALRLHACARDGVHVVVRACQSPKSFVRVQWPVAVAVAAAYTAMSDQMQP